MNQRKPRHENEHEILSLLKSLNAAGTTIIMVTHESDIADQADRIITMRDGKIISDRRTNKKKKTTDPISSNISLSDPGANISEILSYLRQAVASLLSHKMRSFLSILGILIGVTSVITMMAIGRGAQESIETQLNSLGSNVLSVRPGSMRTHGVALESGTVTRLTSRTQRKWALSRNQRRFGDRVRQGADRVRQQELEHFRAGSGPGIRRNPVPEADRRKFHRQGCRHEKKPRCSAIVTRELFAVTRIPSENDQDQPREFYCRRGSSRTGLDGPIRQRRYGADPGDDRHVQADGQDIHRFHRRSGQIAGSYRPGQEIDQGDDRAPPPSRP